MGLHSDDIFLLIWCVIKSILVCRMDFRISDVHFIICFILPRFVVFLFITFVGAAVDASCIWGHFGSAIKEINASSFRVWFYSFDSQPIVLSIEPDAFSKCRHSFHFMHFIQKENSMRDCMALKTHRERTFKWKWNQRCLRVIAECIAAAMLKGIRNNVCDWDWIKNEIPASFIRSQSLDHIEPENMHSILFRSEFR